MPKKAFTLVEIIVVIAIIGVLAITVSKYDFNSKTDYEKRERIAGKVASMLNTEKINTVTGKGVKDPVSGKIVNYDYSKVTINSAGVVVNYYDASGNKLASGESFTYPFFGESNYRMKDVVIKEGAISKSGSVVELTFNGRNSTITLSGTLSDGNPIDPNNTTSIELPIGYGTDYKKVMFDPRTGKTDFSAPISYSLVSAPNMTYSWSTTWTACSVSCGTGTRQKYSICKRSDGVDVPDSLCASAVGPKPVGSEACSPGPCTPSCATQPSYAHATFTVGTPTSVNQAWALGASSCGFTCTGGYSGPTCSVAPNSCATQPSYAHATFTVGTPTSVNQAWALGASSCGFTCTGGYSGPTCATPPAVNGACNNTVNGGCLAGTLSWINNTVSCGTTATWQCLGLYGGSPSPTCSRSNGACGYYYDSAGVYGWVDDGCGGTIWSMISECNAGDTRTGINPNVITGTIDPPPYTTSTWIVECTPGYTDDGCGGTVWDECAIDNSHWEYTVTDPPPYNTYGPNPTPYICYHLY